MRVQLRNFVRVAALIVIGGLSVLNASADSVEKPFNIEEPNFLLKITNSQAQGDIRRPNAVSNLLGLNTLSYDSRFPESWAWIDPANPLVMTLRFPGGGHQQVNLGLNEVMKLKLHYENSQQSLAAGSWLTVTGIREVAGQLQEVEIEIKIADRYGGYLDQEFVSHLLSEEEKKIALEMGSEIRVLVNDPHPRNLPPNGKDFAPKIQSVNLRGDLRPEVTILTPFPNLEWANARDGHLVKIGSALNMKMVGPAGRASVVLGSMDGVHLTNLKPRHDALTGFDESSLYVYLPTGGALAAAIGEVSSQKLDGLTTPKLALKITGRVERTNIAGFGHSESLVVKGQMDPYLTVDFEQSYSIPFFRFQSDVKVEAVPYDESMFKVSGCDWEVKR